MNANIIVLFETFVDKDWEPGDIIGLIVAVLIVGVMVFGTWALENQHLLSGKK